MTEPTADDRDVDASADQLNACGGDVERVWVHRGFDWQCWYFFRCGAYILGKLEAHAAGTQRLTIAIGKQVVRDRLADAAFNKCR